jgi:hypothetical protein
MIPMTTDQVTEIVNANIGENAELSISGSTPTGSAIVETITGQLISINSKGVNVRTAENKVVSRSLTRVAWIAIDEGDVELSEDDEADMLADMVEEGVIEDDDIETAAAEDGIANLNLPNVDEMNALVAELDGCTTAELADVFGMAAKELRVHLRALGMGVGKGHRYHLTADQIATVRAALTTTEA